MPLIPYSSLKQYFPWTKHIFLHLLYSFYLATPAQRGDGNPKSHRRGNFAFPIFISDFTICVLQPQLGKGRQRSHVLLG